MCSTGVSYIKWKVSYCVVRAASGTVVMAFCCCWSAKKAAVHGKKKDRLKKEDSHVSLSRYQSVSESHKPTLCVTPHITSSLKKEDSHVFLRTSTSESREKPHSTSAACRFDRTGSSSVYYTPFTSISFLEALQAQEHKQISITHRPQERRRLSMGEWKSTWKWIKRRVPSWQKGLET